MRYPKLIAALLLAAAAPLAMALPTPAFAKSSPKPSKADVEGAKLKRLFKDSDEASLRRNPLSALYRGDTRYADQLGDSISDAYFDAERAAAKADLKRLKGIKRDRLSPVDAIAYDVFKWQSESNLRGMDPALLKLTVVRPIDHFYGIQTSYPDLASGDGAAKFESITDYENNLKRHQDYVRYLDAAIGRFKQGMATGVVQPRLIVQNVIDQLNLQLAQGVEGSTFFAPVLKFPETVGPAERVRLRAAHAAAIRDGIHPAYVRLRDFLKNDYLPVAREQVGLSAMPGGAALYDYQIEANTTVKMSADQVHQLGLSEVARIRRDMDVIRVQMGYKGDLKAFFDYFRDDAKFKFKSRDDMKDTFLAIGKTVDANVRSQFSTIPKTALEIRPVPEYREKTDAGGSYNQGTPDGTRPGIFYYNAYDLPSRSKPESETLYLHEAIPGHHFQISLAQENEALPEFMRFGGNTAYIEGWALYAESLWKEMGVESDPAYRFGGLNDEMLRAMRLVVDSGLHTKGWTRDQAIKYMLDNSNMSRTDATAEVERYIAIPGQALAYKIGQLTILKLKARAQAALGAKFDPREFHAQVLDTGALPMAVLEAKIDAWIAGKR
jgi:uncharacterized protein (DUF885 family)